MGITLYVVTSLTLPLCYKTTYFSLTSPYSIPVPYLGSWFSVLFYSEYCVPQESSTHTHNPSSLIHFLTFHFCLYDSSSILLLSVGISKVQLVCLFPSSPINLIADLYYNFCFQYYQNFPLCFVLLISKKRNYCFFHQHKSYLFSLSRPPGSSYRKYLQRIAHTWYSP